MQNIEAPTIGELTAKVSIFFLIRLSVFYSLKFFVWNSS